MTTKFQVSGSRFQVPHRNLKGAVLGGRSVANRKSQIVNGFTMVEMLVTLVLMSLIVLTLMAVFNSTQKAFRASLTQTDYLASGRLVMDMIANDLEKMAPSYSTITNNLPPFGPGMANRQEPLLYDLLFYRLKSPINFYVDPNPYQAGYQPFVQYLPGTSAQRTNVLENFFMLSRQNINGIPSWVGTGYAVDPASQPTNSLYRFVMTTNVAKGDPLMLFSNYVSDVQGAHKDTFVTNTVNWTHVMDGVMDLTLKAYDPDGFRITNSVDRFNEQYITNRNTYFYFIFPWPPALPEYSFLMFSNTVPASVEVQMGVLEKPTLEHAEGILDPAAQLNYLSNHVSQVHIFRQRVWIRSVDPTAYQTQ